MWPKLGEAVFKLKSLKAFSKSLKKALKKSLKASSKHVLALSVEAQVLLAVPPRGARELAVPGGRAAGGLVPQVPRGHPLGGRLLGGGQWHTC